MKKKLKPTAKTPLSSAVVTELPVKTTSLKKKNATPKANGKPAPSLNGNGEKNGLTNLNLHYSNELDSRELLHVLSEVKEGNFTVRLPDDKLGLSAFQHIGILSLEFHVDKLSRPLL